MTEYKEKIIDVETGEEIWRDYTPEEIEASKKAELDVADQEKKAIEAAKAKLTLLAKLGITEEEAKLLLS